MARVKMQKAAAALARGVAKAMADPTASGAGRSGASASEIRAA